MKATMSLEEVSGQIAGQIAGLDVDQKLALIGAIWDTIDLSEIPVPDWHIGIPDTEPGEGDRSRMPRPEMQITR